jgi:hypothetical protein
MDFSLLLALSMQFVFAQEKTVTGVVSDASGPQAQMYVVKGTARGTQADLDGRYSVKALEMYCFSFLGMENKLLLVLQSVINVAESDAKV